MKLKQMIKIKDKYYNFLTKKISFNDLESDLSAMGFYLYSLDNTFEVKQYYDEDPILPTISVQDQATRIFKITI